MTSLYVTYPAGHHGEIDLPVYVADDRDDAEQFIEHCGAVFEKPLSIKRQHELRQLVPKIENVVVITPMITGYHIVSGKRSD